MGYASKYYDPVKAHEYYEQHKQLKGRKTTAGLNETGKAAAKFVKEQLMAEKKQVLEQLKQQVKSRIAELRERVKSQLKGLSKEAKAELRAQLKSEVAAIRGEYKTQKDAIKNQYNEMYYNELEKLKSDSAMTKKSAGKSKGKKGASANTIAKRQATMSKGHARATKWAKSTGN